ncbi:MAG: PAS domain S-box protein [Flavitalea sp.]
MQVSYSHLNILTVEDNPGDLFLVEDMLRSTQLRIENLYSTDRVQQAAEIVQTQPIHIILLDLSLPDSHGLDSFMAIRRVTDKIPVIILTGLSDANVALDAIKSGAQDYLIKGEFNKNMLAKSIQYSLERKYQMETLSDSNERFNMVVRATNDAIWDRDLVAGTIFWVGDSYQRIFGHDVVDSFAPPGEWENLLHPDDKQRVVQKFSNAVGGRQGTTWEDQYRLRKKDGTYAYVHDRGYIIYDNNEPVRMIGSTQDITERKRVEEVVLASEAKYRQMFYKNPYPAWIYDAETQQILEVNDAAIDTYGYSREEFMNLKLSNIYLNEDLQKLNESNEIGDGASGYKAKLWRQRKKSGEVLIAEVTYYSIDYFGKNAVQEHIHDITEERRLQKQLVRQQKIKRQQITEAVLGAQEKERSDIGRELHDNINQILATSKLYLDVILEEEEDANPLIKKSRKNITLAIEEIRKISKSLITPVLDDVGLEQSIKELTRNIHEVKKMRFTLDAKDLDEDLLTNDQKQALYRIVQEQLNNILKHADASNVNIVLNTEGEKIFLFIEDNGKGFNLKDVQKGVGITNMMSRAEVFNGKLEIDSRPGQGCRLKVILNTKTVIPQSTGLQ